MARTDILPQRFEDYRFQEHLIEKVVQKYKNQHARKGNLH